MAKRKITVRNPEAWAARQRKATAAAAALRRAGKIPVSIAAAQRARWPDVAPEVRFWSHVAKSDGCWEWTGHVSHGKYGQFNAGPTTWRAHRYAWTITNGEIPRGQLVCHRCDNMRCVRPDHLFLGSQTDNMRDAKAKGRAYQPGQHGTQGADGRWQKKT